MILGNEDRDTAILKTLSKKTQCPLHHIQFAFRCDDPACHSPFICPEVSCLRLHAHHDSRISMVDFDAKALFQKFLHVEDMVCDDTASQHAKALKQHIDLLKESIKNIYARVKSIDDNYRYLSGDADGALNNEYIKRVEQTCTLNIAVRKDIEELRRKVKLSFPVKDTYFALRPHLINFLAASIPHFRWEAVEEVYSSRYEPVKTEIFHQTLAGRPDLCFVFVGENQLVGSYYSVEYPCQIPAMRKDLKSFMFISKSGSSKFAKFRAQEDSSHHLAVSDKNYICHGNTPSFHDGLNIENKKFSTLEYCLPSGSYESDSKEPEAFYGTLEIKKFMVLQILGRQNGECSKVDDDGQAEEP